MQLVILSDVNAADFIGHAAVPIFRDPSSGRDTWAAMQAGAFKHDTFVFSKDGIRTLFWDASVRDLSRWSADIRGAVEALGK